MERRRQAQSPAKINALLIGEKTVPKGCRVMNVSQNGMQLQCDADGRLLTFKDGDSVDVHLTIQHEGKQRKIAIPSWVRHVTADSVDVEFHRPDPLLVGLIESYRASAQHKLEASLGRKDRRITGNRTAGNITGHEKPAAQSAKQVQKQNNRPFYSVILATVFAVCVITGGYVYTASIDSRISTLETLSKRQSTELSEVQSRLFTASLQEGRYASLNARLTALNDAFVSLESRLTQVVPLPAGAPAPDTTPPDGPANQQELSLADNGPEAVAADNAVDQVTAHTEQRTPVDQVVGGAPQQQAGTPSKPPPGGDALAAITRKPPALPASVDAAKTETGAEAESQVTQGPTRSGKAPASSGPWIINLISSPDKAYVEQFSKQSGAAEQQAVLNSATVNGRQYWRLQITGFESAAAARKHAATVKQELGIKDVWIFRQK